MLKTYSGRRASQNEFELTSFISLLKDKGVTKYLEIGARHGDTFHSVMTSLPIGAHGIAVDLPGGMWGASSSVHALQKAADELRARGYHITVIIGDSTDTNIVDRISMIGPYDAALIDGDHRYEGVKKDWDNYSSLAPIVALHDIVGYDQREKVENNLVEVPRLWGEIKSSHPNTVEFVDTDSKMGIGVCFLR